MKRFTRVVLTVGFIASVATASSTAQEGKDACTRADLTRIADTYFESLRNHTASVLPLAATVKHTENGVVTDVGKGFWETAGQALLRRTLLDTQKCVVATIAVVEEPFSAKTLTPASNGGGRGGPAGGAAPGAAPGGVAGGAAGVGGMFGGPRTLPEEGAVRPILFASRLKVALGKITEIETIVARESDFAFNADGVLKTKDQDWETILPPEQRASRKMLADAANDYFAQFAEGSTVDVPYAQVCDRWENGLQTTATDHDCSPVTFRKRIGANINHGPRRVWVDVEKGIAIAFMAFGGGASASDANPTGSGLVDCHMFRMRDGKVDLIQSIVGPRAASMGWPLEPSE
ncbi:MAG: hypothetical protein IT494_04165 [Gammaproteobacteria bacterium]|nr:hypothetical protein [Gammaproteobacteria bacterium]